jgi:hypothetical protein
MRNRRLRYRVVAAKDKSREVDIFWSRLGLFGPRKEKSKARSKERCRAEDRGRYFYTLKQISPGGYGLCGRKTRSNHGVQVLAVEVAAISLTPPGIGFQLPRMWRSFPLG